MVGFGVKYGVCCNDEQVDYMGRLGTSDDLFEEGQVHTDPIFSI